MIHKFKSNYKCATIHENSTIVSDSFSCILFNNTGEATVTVNGITVKPNCCLSFNEDPEIVINTDFNVLFIHGDTPQKQELNIIETYYKPIINR